MSDIQILTSFESVKKLENCLLDHPQIDLQTTVCLSGGVYARTIFIPAGTILTGAQHKKDHINVCQGDISVTTDEGVKRLTGQHTFATKAGMKRAGIAHTDTWWTTISHTNLTIESEIEEALVEEPETLQTRTKLYLNTQPEETLCLGE